MSSKTNGIISSNEITRRKFIKFGATGAATVSLIGMFGCSSTEEPAEPEATEDASSETAEPTAEPEATTQVITDLTGAEVEVPLEIEKIADLWHAHNQIVIMLGAGDKLVGTTENFKNRAWANVVYPRLAEVEALVVGSGAGEVNYEEALSLEPDVVFASDEEVTENARNQGLTTVNVMFQDYEGLRNNVTLTGQVLGAEAQAAADAWAATLDENIDLVASRTEGIADADKPRILHIVSPQSYTMVDGTNTIVDEWIKLAGGVNAIETEGNRIELTLEEILGSDPDIIIIGSAKPEDVDAFLADEQFSGLTAVQNGFVYANPEGVFPWDRYSGEEALQILWAAKFFNPDLFEDVDMVQKTQEFYSKFYGYDLTDDEATRILEGELPE
ncbi:corrinoid ABC transporter substrate-binding protein [Slackia heliotrinireducens]|uniref:ABC-type Fe3+-hydroxamate transport system, periplasmic component n=1 Tax=Slackia heliotrinireducens (strain ATCC 29202 / DSM 20476 / NCTC 11029 / RHS 1) TaxID=471855 RepID=C7N2H3_SLAHD|nr:ABC transporter substrate-binding protein [Slackia heliotrinireducens]ACV23481.1 ABC-type Fe3+-hydroxamate transport system, periplasmic component [Slackia heliotrinireducens DSM 20476]VEH02828.1 corrinoid ABC transporter substrate-binding protein [Slackia heliotrinireducens]